MENGNKRIEAQAQYQNALRLGEKYYRAAVGRGEYPYPVVLDEIMQKNQSYGYQELGLLQIPTEEIIGTKSRGRTSALAGNMMPLLKLESEFADKWISLCEIHLGDEGIRDPVICYEYMGKFYVAEGNKRVSVLKSFGSPTIPALVTRILPKYSEEPDIRLYYEFLWFYKRSAQYGVYFRNPGMYPKLQAALGFSDEHVWTEDEKRSFRAGYVQFQEAFGKLNGQESPVTEAEALLEWLKVYPFAQIKELPRQELEQKLQAVLQDIQVQNDADAIELNSIQDEKEKGILDKIIGIVKAEHLNVAFIYAFEPESSTWTQAQDDGRKDLEAALGQQVDVKTYVAENRDYDAAFDKAAADGAELVFATTPAMIGACRRAAVRYPKLKILDCAPSLPYSGVRMYYSRLYEAKFITGAIAGAMAENHEIGYVCNYPILGLPASVNAFALGARMTDPKSVIHLDWSCIAGDPVERLLSRGVSVISNRDAGSENQTWTSFEIGTYAVRKNRGFIPLAAPVWNWGKLYERIVRSVFSGGWDELSKSKAIHYWWGMDSDILGVKLFDPLPDGVRSLSEILTAGISSHMIDPFCTRITDQNGTVRNDGSRAFTSEEILGMDWFADSVDGSIPSYNELIPVSRELVRILGIYRDEIPPEKDEVQL